MQGLQLRRQTHRMMDGILAELFRQSVDGGINLFHLLNSCRIIEEGILDSVIRYETGKYNPGLPVTDFRVINMSEGFLQRFEEFDGIGGGMAQFHLDADVSEFLCPQKDGEPGGCKFIAPCLYAGVFEIFGKLRKDKCFIIRRGSKSLCLAYGLIAAL